VGGSVFIVGLILPPKIVYSLGLSSGRARDKLQLTGKTRGEFSTLEMAVCVPCILFVTE